PPPPSGTPAAAPAPGKTATPTPKAAASPAPAAEQTAAATPAGAKKENGKTGEGGPVRLPFLAVNNLDMPTVLRQIQDKTGDQVVAKGTVTSAKVKLAVQNKTTEEILDILAAENGWVWWQRDDGAYEIMDKDTYEKTVLVQMVVRKTFRPKYRTAQEIAQAIDGIKTPNIGSIATDPTTNKVMVTDLPDRIAVMQRVIDEIDIPLYTRFFRIRHAQVADIQGQLSTLLSEVGSLQIDERTHQIVVRDLLENIKQMELLVMALDVGPEVRVYDVTNIGMDHDMFDLLVDNITKVVTNEAAIKSDFNAGRIYVEDMPEVHDRIERLLKVFDSPAKQIFLQAEIVEVSLDRALDYSFDLGVSSAGMPQVLGSPTGTTVAGSSLSFLDLHKLGFYPFGKVSGAGLLFQDLGEHYSLNLSALLSDTDTKFLLKPRILAKNQQEARIHVGSNEPILNTFNTGYDPNNPNRYVSTSQTTVTTGLDVTFMPSISNTGLVEMKINMVNSSPFRVSVLNQGQKSDLLGTNDQEIDTVLLIPSGETRVLGGFIRHQKTQTKFGVPGLRDLPLVGPLFGSYSDSEQDRTLLFFLTPTIVEEKPRYDILKTAQEGYADLVGERRNALAAESEGAPSNWQASAATTAEGFTTGTTETTRGEELPLAAKTAGLESEGAKEEAAGQPAPEPIAATEETGPFAQAPASESLAELAASAPEVTLSSELPSSMPSTGGSESLFGDRAIKQVKTSYKAAIKGPSGQIKPSTGGGATTGGPSKAAPVTVAGGKAASQPGGTKVATPRPTPVRRPTPTPQAGQPTPLAIMPLLTPAGLMTPAPAQSAVTPATGTPIVTPAITFPPLPPPPTPPQFTPAPQQ
ncbi:MAG: hypothetical protein NTW86_32865, partial [Candidatus Sumerlaeota bacterium]|nr:hypothetical protein [Candidatus Sumerlaeota bacterium]